MRMLAEYPGSPERLATRSPELARRLELDASDELGASGAMEVRRQVSPAGQRSELERFHRGELLSCRPSPPPLQSVRHSPIEPGTPNELAGEQGRGRARAGPIGRALNEMLLAAVSQDVEQALDLRGGLVRHQDRLIAAPPELLPPLHLATDLAGEIRVQVVHEGSQPVGSLDGEQQVEMIGEEAEGMDLDGVEARRAGERSADEVGDERRGCQQATPLNGAARHLDQGTGRNEAKSSAHGE